MLNVELYFNMVHVRVHASVLGAFEESPVKFRVDDVLLLLSFDEANMVVIYVSELAVIGFALERTVWMDTCPSYSTLVFPERARFVLMMITPFVPRVP